MKPANKNISFWPVGLCLLIFLFLALTGWSIHQATTQVSSVTNPRYYSHGLKYNETLIEKEAATALGWQLETSLEGRRLLFRLRDGSGNTVSGARGEVVLFDAVRRRNLVLEETVSGTYTADLPEDAASGLSARIALRLGGASLSRTLLVNL